MIEILHDLWGGFLTNFTLYNLMVIFLGSMVGTVVGALPGLGPSAGLALMIPLTFTMESSAGLRCSSAFIWAVCSAAGLLPS